MPILVSLSHPSFQALGKTQMVVFPISGQSLIKKNCHNSRTSDDIDIKLGPGTKFDSRNKTTSKKLAMTSCLQIVTSLLFFQFLTNLEADSGLIVCKT